MTDLLPGFDYRPYRIPRRVGPSREPVSISAAGRRTAWTEGQMVMIRPEARGQWPPPMGPALRAERGLYARPQDQLAEPHIRRLADLVGADPGLQVFQDGLHDRITPREGGMPEEGLDPFDDRGFEAHGDSLSMRSSKDGLLGVPTGTRAKSNYRANPAGRRAVPARHAAGGGRHAVSPGPICPIPEGVRATFLAGPS
jgi:hypothetical protein